MINYYSSFIVTNSYVLTINLVKFVFSALRCVIHNVESSSRLVSRIMFRGVADIFLFCGRNNSSYRWCNQNCGRNNSSYRWCNQNAEYVSQILSQNMPTEQIFHSHKAKKSCESKCEEHPTRESLADIYLHT